MYIQYTTIIKSLADYSIKFKAELHCFDISDGFLGINLLFIVPCDRLRALDT